MPKTKNQHRAVKSLRLQTESRKNHTRDGTLFRAGRVPFVVMLGDLYVVGKSVPAYIKAYPSQNQFIAVISSSPTYSTVNNSETHFKLLSKSTTFKD